MFRLLLLYTLTADIIRLAAIDRLHDGRHAEQDLRRPRNIIVNIIRHQPHTHTHNGSDQIIIKRDF